MTDTANDMILEKQTADMYFAKCGESGYLGAWGWTRVPGGWIFNYPNNPTTPAVFVPYSEE